MSASARAARTGLERVLVVGAGPVGMLLAARLAHLRVAARLVERRPAPSGGSRAVGVHPPGLAALALVGAADEVEGSGVRIAGGRAVGANGPLGRLAFGPDAPVWAVPQAVTEAAVERALERNGGSVERGVTLTGLRRGHDGALVASLAGTASGDDAEAPFDLVVGTDGRDSTVRTLAGIGRHGGPYPDRYAMADVRDGSGLGSDASIHLHRDGLVESFPLPGGWRRLVVRLPDDDGGRAAAQRPRGAAPDPVLARRVCELAAARGVDGFDPVGARMTSAFGVERWLATRFVLGRVVLAGDAAHVLSPIGGQGMNLGWIDAVTLAEAIVRVRDRGPAAWGPELDAYAQRRRRAAQVAIARAAWNTRLGRPRHAWRAALRDAVLRRALRPPFERALVGAFTMRGLS